MLERAEAGAIEGLIDAMHAHPQIVAVQECACGALGNVRPRKIRLKAVSGEYQIPLLPLYGHPYELCETDFSNLHLEIWHEISAFSATFMRMS